MGCSSSSAAASATRTTEDEFDGEEEIHVAMKVKRRYKNVFAESQNPDANWAPQVHEKSKAEVDRITAALNANKFSDLFQSFSDSEMEKFISYMEKEEIAAGTDIMTQGDDGDYFYVLDSGTVDYEKDGTVVGSGSAPASFGELALIFGSPRQVTVKVSSQSSAFRVDRQTFRFTMANTAAKAAAAKVAALHDVPVLKMLTESQKALLADATHELHVPAGRKIITKGDDKNVNLFYIVSEGEVQVTEQDGNLEAISLGGGACFGELALLNNAPRAATVTATKDTTLYTVDREDFMSLLGGNLDLVRENSYMHIISGVSMLSTLHQDELQKMVKSFQQQTFAPGDKVIRQGDVGDKFYIISRGTADVLLSTNTNNTKVVTLKTGDYFGEMALLSEEPRVASIVAKEPLVCLALTKGDFQTIVGSIDDFRARNKERMLTLNEVKSHPTKRNIPQKELRELQMLGAGTFGKVKLVEHKTTKDKETYALKVMVKAEIIAQKQEANVEEEKRLMKQADHPFILKLFCEYEDSKQIYLLLEFVQGGELFSVVHKETHDGVPVEDCRFYAACVMSVLGYLHSMDVIYRDLKPENILIDTEGYAKVIDFGFAKPLRAGGKTYTLCGTPEYLAPEIVLGRGYSHSVDWWAFGILCYEMIAGYSPFADKHCDQLVTCRNIVNGHLKFPKKFDSGCKSLIKKLLEKDIGKRLSNYGGIAADPFLGVINMDQLQQKNYPGGAPWIPEVKDKYDTSLFEPEEF